MFANQLFGQRCCLHLHPSYFENRYYGWIFEKISKYNEKYGQLPSMKNVVNQIKSIKAEEQPNYKKSFKQVVDAKLEEEDYLKDTLKEFIKASEFRRLHAKAGELYNEGKYEEAYRFTQERSQEISQIRFEDESYVKPEDIVPILRSQMEAKENGGVLVTGIDPLDEFLDGGIYKGEVTTLIGGYNVGKTITAINIACENIEKGKRVLFIYHEGREADIVTKFVSRLTGIPYNTIKAWNVLTEEDHARIKTAEKLIGEHLRIKEMRKIGVDVYDVVAYTKETFAEWPFDMLVDDYAMILDPGSNKRSKRFEKRHQIAENWRVLDQLSSEKDGLNIAVLTLAQFNREGKKKEGVVLRSDDIAECIDIAKISATILTLSEIDGDIVVCLDKSRSAQKGFMLKVFSDMGRMKIFHRSLDWEKMGFFDPAQHGANRKPQYGTSNQSTN